MRRVRSRASEASRGGAPAQDPSSIGNVNQPSASRSRVPQCARPVHASRNARVPFTRPAMRASRNARVPQCARPAMRASRNARVPQCARPAMRAPRNARVPQCARPAMRASRNARAYPITGNRTVPFERAMFSFWFFA